MKAAEIKAKARHEIDTPGHPDYGKPIYTFTESDLNALIREELLSFCRKNLSPDIIGDEVVLVDYYLKSQQ